MRPILRTILGRGIRSIAAFGFGNIRTCITKSGLVTGLAARVVMDATGIRPRTHMTMLVEAERQLFLADVGFGATGLLEPSPFIAGREVELPLVSFRLAEHQGLWTLQSTQQGQWSDLYAFTPRAPGARRL